MGSNPISSAGEPLPIGRGSCFSRGASVAPVVPEGASVPRYFVKIDAVVEAEDQRLVTVELEGRLLDGTTRPPGVRVDQALVVTVLEQPEREE